MIENNLIFIIEIYFRNQDTLQHVTDSDILQDDIL